jgi:hypothetical protein
MLSLLHEAEIGGKMDQTRGIRIAELDAAGNAKLLAHRSLSRPPSVPAQRAAETALPRAQKSPRDFEVLAGRSASAEAAANIGD